MEPVKDGKLKQMAACARYIDESLVELERALSSADALMPNEAHHDEAHNIMVSFLEEITTMDKNTQAMKSQLEAIFEASDSQVKKVHQQNITMFETLSEIENTLKNYGYDASEMPEFNPDEIQDEQSSMSSSDTETELNAKEEQSNAVQQHLNLIPQCSNSSVSSELDITPIFTSSNSRSRLHLSVPTTPGFTPLSRKFRTPLREKSQAQAPHTLPIYLTDSVAKKTPKVLEKPKRPILSEYTYQLLGEQPPPEFYEKENSQN